MTLFLDTANLEEIKKYAKWGIISGITTNPKIFGKEKEHVTYEERVRDILDVLPVPLSVELTKTGGSVDELIREAREYHDINPMHVVIKVPMWGDGKGVQIAKALELDDIPVNMTCLMSLHQGIVASELNVTYASLFYNRIWDYNKVDLELGCEEGKRLALQTFMDLRRYVDSRNLETKIIAGSIRSVCDVGDVLSNGAHIATITPDILRDVCFHPKTEETITEFDDAWRRFEARR